MELKQNQIHRKYKKCEAKKQITIGGDYSVPEGKPDISSILQKKAEFQVDEVHTEKGKIKLRGALRVYVLYLTQRSSETVNSLEMEFPFDEVLYMEGAASGDNLKIDWNIEDLRVTIIHPGKLSVRSLVMLMGEVEALESHMVSTAPEEGWNILTKEETFVMTEPVIERRDSYRIRDEISLLANKPNVQKILWKDLQMRGLDIQLQEGRIAVKGELQMLVLYQSEDEVSSVQWIEQMVPFQGTLDVTGITPEMFGFFETEISHQNVEVKADYDGEMRMFHLELLLEIHMHIFEERSCPYLVDAYSTTKDLKLQTEEIRYEKLRMCNRTIYRLDGRESVNEDTNILQIIGHHGNLSNKRYRISAQGILCEGTLEVQVIYVTASDSQPFGNVTFFIPYSQVIEVPGIDDEDRLSVTERIDQIVVGMPEGNQMEVRANLRFDTCIMQQCTLNNKKDILCENYDMEAYKNAPAMKIHFVQPHETLWDIAKAHRTTKEAILKLNELTGSEVIPGQKILLVKDAMLNGDLHL